MATQLRTPALLSTRTLARALGSLAFAACLVPSLAEANVNKVTVCANNCDFTTIQAAVDAASDGDHIIVEEDRVESVVVDRAISLAIRYDWNTRRTLDAGGADYALHVGPDADVSVWGLDITGATTAAVYNEGTVRLRNTYVVGNVATYGALMNTGHMVLRDGSLVANNESLSFFAGGLNNFGGVVNTWGSGATFLGNTGYNGGALANHSGTVNIRSCSFTANTAYLGGAIHNSFGDLSIEDSSFSTNYADSLGGAWSNHNVGGTVTVSNVGYAANDTGSGQFLDCYDVNGGCTQ